MKKFNLSYRTHLLRIAAILCLLSSYLWIAPSQVHALSASSQGDYALGNEEQTYVTGDATADSQMAYYDRWKSGYEAGLHSSVFASDQEQTQPQTSALSLGEHLWSTDPFQTDGFSLSISKGDVSQTPGESNPSAPLQNGQTTTLTVDIISSPWATLDSNDPDGSHGAVPQVFVVEAVVTNTGTISAAEDLRVVLDYNEDPENNWELLPGEIQLRTVDSLAPGEAYYAYWFATYTTTLDVGHQYTVTAWADNADPVATSDNYYGNPELGKTVKTRSTLSTGNSGVIQTSAEVIVGVAFTVTVKYDLGTNPGEAIFSPVGNFDFDPSAYRLMATEADLYSIDSGGNPISDLLTVTDHLYLPLPEFPAATDVGADVTYTFIALRPTNTQLCPYTVVQKGTASPKYDQFYCAGDTIVPITGTLTLSMTKQASSPTVQQDQPLTYTIYYTNTGDQPLSYVWIWDVVDTDSASIIPASINPASDPGETTDSQVAWYLDNVGSSGQVTGTGTLAFTILIDGDHQYLADHPLLVNHAFLGFNPGSLPENVVLTSTVTTNIQVPVLTITKSDFPDPVLTDHLITYTLHYTNSGLAPATNVLITDVVPPGTTYQTCSGGSACGESNGVVSWNIGTVPSDTNNATVSFSVLVSDALETGTLIRNEDYGIVADQTGFIPGPLVTTLVNREAAFFEGYTFIDADGDGFYDASEGTLSDITVTLPDAAVSVTTTDGNGYYHFRVETEGPISVTADLPTGYFRTTPGTVFLESTFWTTQTVDFGYAPTSSGFAAIYGIVFEDTDGDGVQDAGETGLSGVTVTLDGGTATTTDDYGRYAFSTTVAGVHTVVETDPSGYLSTTPNEVHVDVTLGNGYRVDFGDAPDSSGFATIYGTVFEDADGDGVWDADETGLSGVTVTLDGGTAITTDDYGSYNFSTSVAGVHTVVETDPSGYFSTTPNEVHVDVTLGNGYRVDFGDAPDSSLFATIYGTVFEDADGDGVWDADETGLSGVTVTLDDSTTTTTDDYGSYSFFTTVAEVHTVVETDPDGYSSTTPNEVHVDVTLGNGYQVDFGDAPGAGDIYLPIIMRNY